MAFDMFAGTISDHIGHNEEFLFQLMEEDETRYPQLMALWESFYDSPRLSSAQAGLLVHELIDLLCVHGGATNKPLAACVIRLLGFFSQAHRKGLEIRCFSD